MSKTPNPELLTDLENTQTPRKNRLFEAGHMKLVVLNLISPDLYNSEDYATRQALNTRPSTLRIVRYTCS